MKHTPRFKGLVTWVFAAFALSACSGGSGDSSSLSSFHVPVSIVDGGVAAQGTVSSSAIINIGTIYLEQQYAPPSVSGVSLQASGVDVKGSNIYVSYSYRDTTGAVRAGAIQHITPAICDNLATAYTDYCLVFGGTLNFTNSDIYSTTTDGTNLYAVGSTTNASADPYYGRLYKVSLSAGADPLAITGTATLPSYVGTSVALSGANVLTTYGTSTSAGMMGGFGTFNSSTLAAVNAQSIYDARWVAVDPSSAATAYIVTGATNGALAPGKTLKVNADASGSVLATYSSGGNTIAESRSTVIAGNSLLISSAGDGGLTVMCKATGAILATKAAPVLANVPTSTSVTNGIAAVPGYLFVANGEAGIYVYNFNKSNVLNSNYCQGVTLTLVGRLALAADPTGNTYVNAELSANSIKAVTILSVLNVVTSRLLVVASGNKGVSLLNVTNLTVSLTAVDDF